MATKHWAKNRPRLQDRLLSSKSIMNIQTLEALENQAWALLVRLNKRVDSECVGRAARSTPSVRKERLIHARTRLFMPIPSKR